ncbi:MAG: rod shape-determining protein MreC [Bacteroidota bacterium]|nr:rod shape-determining protein MreC [Bacteroidota bacterium]MDE2957580.1 rod shape-determining protein MreC [Bacteroidota bacterium]
MIALWTRLRDYVIFGMLLMVGILFMLSMNDSMTRGLRIVALEISGTVESRLAWLGTLSFALADNERLRRENARLTSQLGQTRVAMLENERLKEALGFKQDEAVQLVAGRVVARDRFGQSNFFTLDVGGSDGVEIDMAVIDVRGILGRVVQVSSGYSRVMSYLNTDFHVPAMIESTLAVGMISWSGVRRDVLLLENVVNTETVVPGQRVITHQASEVFPPFLTVGTISEVNPKPSLNSWAIEVEPAAKLHTAQFAFVVFKFEDPERLRLEQEPIP